MKRKFSFFSIIALTCFFQLNIFISSTMAQSLDEIVESQSEVNQPLVEQIEEPQTAPADPKPASTDKVAALRARIVELASSKVGTVKNKAGEDGFKIGWQNLKEFYEVAYKLDSIEKDRPWWMKDIQTVGKKINDWCGIFGVWAWRTAGLPVHWNTRIIGCPYRGQKNLLAAGDIVIIKKSVNPYNHHCIVKTVNGNAVETIDGNQGTDSIQFKSRKLDDIEIFYSVAEASGAAPQAQNASSGQTKPASGKKPATVAGGSSKPAPTTGTVKPKTSTPAKPSTPSPANSQPDEKELQDLIRQIFNLIRISFGSFV